MNEAKTSPQLPNTGGGGGGGGGRRDIFKINSNILLQLNEHKQEVVIN